MNGTDAEREHGESVPECRASVCGGLWPRLDYSSFFAAMNRGPEPLARWANGRLPEQIYAGIWGSNNGHLPRWKQALEWLPEVAAASVCVDTGAFDVSAAPPCSEDVSRRIEEQLRAFHPWRKGPFCIHSVRVETEWRSDWKWARVADKIADLTGRTVLDVGCGSGYHVWRMLAAGAGLVVGVDPFLAFVMQYHAIRHFIGQNRLAGGAVLPLRFEDLPVATGAFDTVFSMGVLYHRRSPFDHLFELKEQLRRGGELVLETLVIEGGCNDVLVPAGRYAKMRNVWFIPSVEALQHWLEKAGFENARCIDISTTTTDEQRTTDWMHFESLADFLTPGDQSKTVEGHPAPVRATFLANRK